MPKQLIVSTRRPSRRSSKANNPTPPRDVAAMLAEMGYDPIEGLVGIAASGDTPAKLRRKTFLTLSQFVLPNSRLIEILRTLINSPRPEELFK